MTRRIFRWIIWRIGIAGGFGAAWTLIASTIWAKGTGSTLGPAGWWYAAGNFWGANWYCNLWIVLAAALPTIFGGLFGFGLFMWLRWQGQNSRKLVRGRDGEIRPTEPGVTDNHGHARWATSKEIAAKFSGPGCLIGAMDRGVKSRLLFDDSPKARRTA